MRSTLTPESMGIKGTYTLELFQRGRKVEEIKKDNYITPAWVQFVKSLQLHYPMVYGFPYNNGASLLRTDSYYNLPVYPDGNERRWNPYHSRPFPFNSVILTDWSDAENTAEHWLKGKVSAFGTLWKAGSVPASGPRGQINEAECTITGNHNVFKWVWDWSTQQGNGSYQTLAMGAIAHGTMAAPINNRGPHMIVGTTPTAGGSSASYPYDNPGGIAYNPNTGKWIYITNNTSSPYITTATDSGTQVADSDIEGTGLVHDINAMTWSLVTSSSGVGVTFTTSGSSTTSSGYANPCGIYPCDDGSIIVSYHCRSNGYIRMTKLTSAGANVWTQNIGANSTGTYFANTGSISGISMGIVQVGAYYYLVNGSNNTGSTDHASIHADHKKILRINPADGSLSANIALPADHYAINNGGPLTTDGTNLFVSTNRGIIKMGTDGTVIDYLGLVFGNATTEIGSAPWSTSSFGDQVFEFFGSQVASPIRQLRDSTRLNSISANPPPFPWFASGASPSSMSQLPGNMLYWNDRLWVYFYPPQQMASPADRIWLMGVNGGSMLSRALLDSPVTKTSSQTMKVSYELTMPDPFGAEVILDHPTV